jgi:hypothetical protein
MRSLVLASLLSVLSHAAAFVVSPLLLRPWAGAADCRSGAQRSFHARAFSRAELYVAKRWRVGFSTVSMNSGGAGAAEGAPDEDEPFDIGPPDPKVTVVDCEVSVCPPHAARILQPPTASTCGLLDRHRRGM